MIRGASVWLLAAIALAPASVLAADSGPYLPEQMIVNPAGQPVLTPQQAESLVKSMWVARHRVYGSPGQTDYLETQAAAEFDNSAWITLFKDYGFPGEIRTVNVLVPRLASFPAFFMAVVKTSERSRPDRSEGLVFTRRSEAGPWKLAIDTPLDVLASDLKFVFDADEYVTPTGRVGLTTVAPENVYAVVAAGGSTFTCYSYHSTAASTRSWLSPQHVTNSFYLKDGYYTRVTTTTVAQGCGRLTASGDGESLGLLSGTVAMNGANDPPPWLWMGIVGLALVAAAYAALSLLGRGLAPVDLSAVDATAPSPPVKSWTALERRATITALVLVAIEAAVLYEIIRAIASTRPEVGLGLLALAIGWFLILTPPWLRRVRVQASMVIPASPEAVTAALVDETSPNAWEGELVSVERLTEGTPVVGATYRHVQRLSSGGLAEVVKVVTEYIPGRVYAVRYVMSNPQVERFTLVADPEGTRVTSTLEATMTRFHAMSGMVLFRGAALQHRAKRLAELARLSRRVTGKDVAPHDAAAPDAKRRLPAWLRVGLPVMTLTGLLSLGGYALVFGAIFGTLLMVTLVIHELGHFAEARRYGLSVRLPFFIPFIGAATTMRNMPGDAATHAKIALAGPLCGMLAVAAACLAAGQTNAQGLVFFAQVGGLINLVNLAPMGILDGGTILAPISRWISVAGVVLAGLLVAFLALTNEFSPIVLVIAGFAVYGVVSRFRRHRTQHYRSVRRRAKLVLGLVWVAAGGYLFFVTGATSIAMLTW